MSTDEIEKQVRRFVSDRYERGCSFVKTPHVAKALDETPQRIAPIMQDLVRSGTLEIWTDCSNAKTYRIQIDEH